MWNTECVVLELGDFVPWDNEDNVASLKMVEQAEFAKDLIFLPVTFIVGFPANILNMAIFYR